MQITVLTIDCISLLISIIGFFLALQTFIETRGRFYLWFFLLSVAWLAGYICFVISDIIPYPEVNGYPLLFIVGEIIFCAFSCVYIALLLIRFRLFDVFLKYPLYLFYIAETMQVILGLGYIASLFLVKLDKDRVKGLRWTVHFVFYAFAGSIDIIVAISSLMVINSIKAQLAKMQENAGVANHQMISLLKRVVAAIMCQFICFITAFVAVLVLDARLSYSVRAFAAVCLLQFSRLYFKYIVEVVALNATNPSSRKSNTASNPLQSKTPKTTGQSLVKSSSVYPDADKNGSGTLI